MVTSLEDVAGYGGAKGLHIQHHVFRYCVVTPHNKEADRCRNEGTDVSLRHTTRHDVILGVGKLFITAGHPSVRARYNRTQNGRTTIFLPLKNVRFVKLSVKKFDLTKIYAVKKTWCNRCANFL